MLPRHSQKLIFILVFLFSPLALASPLGFKKYSFLAFLEAGFFSTTKNLDSGGSMISLPQGYEFNEQKYNLLASYDWSDRFSTFGQLTYKRNSSVDNRLERSSAAPSDLGFGFDYLLLASKWINIIPEIFVNIPLHSVSSDQDDVLLGEGAYTITPRLNASKHFDFLYLFAFVGYSYRTRDLSHLLPYGVGAHKELDHFFLEALVSGAQTIKDDGVHRLERDLLNARVNAASSIYNSPNPSWLNVLARGGWRIEPNIFVTAGVEQTINGANAAYGTRFMIGFGITEFIGGGRKKLSDIKAAPHHVGDEEAFEEEQRVRKFKVETRSEEEQTPQLEPFEVEIRRAKPTKKDKRVPRTKLRQ